MMSISPGSQAPRVERHKEFNVVPTAPWAAPNEDFHHMDGTHMST